MSLKLKGQISRDSQVEFKHSSLNAKVHNKENHHGPIDTYKKE